MEVRVPLPPGTAAKSVQLSVTKTSLTLGLKGREGPVLKVTTAEVAVVVVVFVVIAVVAAAVVTVAVFVVAAAVSTVDVVYTALFFFFGSGGDVTYLTCMV